MSDILLATGKIVELFVILLNHPETSLKERKKDGNEKELKKRSLTHIVGIPKSFCTIILEFFYKLSYRICIAPQMS